MDGSQFESSRLPYRRSMFGRRAFSSDKEAYQPFPSGGPGLRTYSGNLSYHDGGGGGYQAPDDLRRYSLTQQTGYDPLASPYSAVTGGGYGAPNAICDKLRNPTTTSIINERSLPFVPFSGAAKPAGATASSLTASSMALAPGQLDSSLLHAQSSSSVVGPSQRLMPRLPFKSHSTESKLIGQHPAGSSAASHYMRTKPIVEPDVGYFDDANVETTFTSGRRLSGHFGFTPTYLNHKSKLNESLQRRQLNQLDRLESSRLVDNRLLVESRMLENRLDNRLDARLDAMNGANYGISSFSNFSNPNLLANQATNPLNQPAANYMDASKPIQSTGSLQQQSGGFFSSAKSMLSGSMGSLIGGNRTVSGPMSNSLNAMNQMYPMNPMTNPNPMNQNLSNVQVPSMNYLTTNDLLTNSASNSSILTNPTTLTGSTINPLPAAKSYGAPLACTSQPLPGSAAKAAAFYGTNRHLNSAANRILLRQESDQTDLRKANRLLHSSASYSATSYNPGAAFDSLTAAYSTGGPSRASTTIKSNYLKFDKRNRLKYQLSFSSADEDPDEEFHSSDCSVDYDDNYHLIQVKKPSYPSIRRRSKLIGYPPSKGHYTVNSMTGGMYGPADECLDDEYERSLDERYNLRNRRQAFRLTHGQQYFSELGSSVQGKFLLSPITWTPSEDGHYMIGHIYLNNSLIQQLQHQRLSSEMNDDPLLENENYANVLGLKVIDGAAYGREGAIIERVNSGSIASLVAKLRKGAFNRRVAISLSLCRRHFDLSIWYLFLHFKCIRICIYKIIAESLKTSRGC